MCEKGDQCFVMDGRLGQVSGGIGTSREAEIHCPNCGQVTTANQVTSTLYTCTICHSKHNGERVVGIPRA